MVAAGRPARGMDAVYIALAERLAEQTAVGLFSFDQRQREALALGSPQVSVLPAELPSTPAATRGV